MKVMEDDSIVITFFVGDGESRMERKIKKSQLSVERQALMFGVSSITF